MLSTELCLGRSELHKGPPLCTTMQLDVVGGWPHKNLQFVDGFQSSTEGRKCRLTANNVARAQRFDEVGVIDSVQNDGEILA